jgi:hypothetical protein
MLTATLAGQSVVAKRSCTADALGRLIGDLESLVKTVRTDIYVGPRDDSGATVGDYVARSVARIDGLLIRHTPASLRDATYAGLADDPVAALRKLRALKTLTIGWPRRPHGGVLRVVHAAHSPEDAEIAWSSLETELAFVVSETIEAERRIAALMARRGIAAPDGFGSMPPPALPARGSAPPSRALARRLDAIAALVSMLPTGVYTTRVDGRVSGTVGEHVRHCLDHVAALAVVGPGATLSYDRRARGTAVEREPEAALSEIGRLKTAIDGLAARPLDERIRVSSMVDVSGECVVVASTIGRELAFVISHTIHHQATIAAVLALQGIEPPAAFGYAPSTLRPH